MGPEFHFEESWEGWQSVRSPDNIEFKIVFSDGEDVTASASLLDLTDLHKLIHGNKECDRMIGTGNIIQIQNCNGEVQFMLDETHTVITTFNQLEQAIDELLYEVFSELGGSPTQIPEYQRDEYPQVEELYNKIM